MKNLSPQERLLAEIYAHDRFSIRAIDAIMMFLWRLGEIPLVGRPFDRVGDLIEAGRRRRVYRLYQKGKIPK